MRDLTITPAPAKHGHKYVTVHCAKCVAQPRNIRASWVGTDRGGCRCDIAGGSAAVLSPLTKAFDAAFAAPANRAADGRSPGVVPPSLDLSKVFPDRTSDLINLVTELGSDIRDLRREQAEIRGLLNQLVAALPPKPGLKSYDLKRTPGFTYESLIKSLPAAQRRAAAEKNGQRGLELAALAESARTQESKNTLEDCLGVETAYMQHLDERGARALSNEALARMKIMEKALEQWAVIE